MTASLLISMIFLQGNYGILPTGDFHENEVDSTAFGNWKALVLQEGQWQLVTMEPSLSRVYDPLLDREGEASGWRVWDERAKALLFLRPVEGYPEGNVSIRMLNTPDLSPGDEVVLDDGERIVAEEGGVYFYRGERRQRISDIYENLYGEGVSILLAGDLDGDGLTDLVVNDRGHYAIYLHYRLFLSGGAKEGYLLRVAGEFIAGSC